MRVADQFPELGESTDVWNPGEEHIQRCLFVVNQGLVSGFPLWLRLNTSLHTSLNFSLLAEKPEQEVVWVSFVQQCKILKQLDLGLTRK
jgi:hypothetical protein